MKEYFEEEGYEQIVETIKGKIVNALCTCKYGSLHPEAFKEGMTLCKHLKKILKNAKERI
jgi:hypothetical protein